MRRARAAVASAAAFASLGCYGSIAVPPEQAARSQQVVLELTDGGSVALAQSLGPQLARVTGRVEQYSPSTGYAVFVSETTTRSGIETPWKGERVVIAESMVRKTFERRLSKGRTTAMAAAFVGGALLVAKAFGLDIGLSGLINGGNKPTPQ